MRRLGSSNNSSLLGLTLGDREITCAQVAAAGADRVVTKVGRFATPDAIPLLDRAEEAGRALRQFLDEHHFTASAVVVGVPARWIMAQEKELPPTDATQAVAILRLQGERMSLGESGSLVVDFAGDLSSTAASPKVLLVGMLRTQIERIRKLIDSAGLSLKAICPSALATSAMVGGDHSMLHLANDGAELVQWQSGSPRLLRPIGAASDPAAAGAEMRRTLTMRSGATGDLLLCDGVGLDTATRAQLLTRIGGDAHVMSPDPSLHVRIDSGAMNGASVGLAGNAHLPAIAMGVAGLGRARLPVDFLQSKLIEQKQARFGRPVVLGAGAGAIAVVAILGLYFTATSREQEAAEIGDRVKAMAADVKTARAEIARVAYGRSFFDTRPPYLDCMRELSMAFNYDDPIWVSSIHMPDGKTVSLEGRSTNQGLVFALLDRLKQNKNFVGAQMPQLRDAAGTGQGGNRTTEISFTIQFQYQPPASPAAPAKK